MKTLKQFLLTEDTSLPQLTGSEKQVTWAEIIRSSLIKKTRSNFSTIFGEENIIIDKIFEIVAPQSKRKDVLHSHGYNYNTLSDDDPMYDKKDDENKNNIKKIILDTVNDFFNKISDSKFYIDNRDSFPTAVSNHIQSKKKYF